MGCGDGRGRGDRQAAAQGAALGQRDHHDARALEQQQLVAGPLVDVREVVGSHPFGHRAAPVGGGWEPAVAALEVHAQLTALFRGDAIERRPEHVAAAVAVQIDDVRLHDAVRDGDLVHGKGFGVVCVRRDSEEQRDEHETGPDPGSSEHAA